LSGWSTPLSTRPRAKRPYTSRRRKEQATETHLHILEAARRLFADRGYTGTTVEGIAREAGVSTETVYSIFGTKRNVLYRLVEMAVLGDERSIPLMERPRPQEVRRQTDQRAQVRLFAADRRKIMGRVSPFFEIMDTAAGSEPEIAALRAKW